jgi:hypothetical protein
MINAIRATIALMPAVSAAPTQKRAVSIRPFRLSRGAASRSATAVSGMSSCWVLKVGVVMVLRLPR